jgi:hypothetical protein
LALAVFQEQLAVIGAKQGFGGDAFRLAAIERRVGAMEKQVVGGGDGRHA